MKRCNYCKKNKEDREFVTSAGKPSTRCIKCREYRRKKAFEHYHRWHDEIRKYDRTYYHENRERYMEMRKRNRLRTKYGITLEDYEKMFSLQKGKCGICGIVFIVNRKKGWGGKKEPCVDHCHKTGKVRGILCRQCNLSLSMIEDENFILKSQQYLSQVKENIG